MCFFNTLKLLNQFWHYLPRDSVRSHRLRAQSYKTAPTLLTPITNPGCLCFCPTHHKLEIPKTPALGSVNLLEQLTELRKSLLTRLQVYYKKDIAQESDGIDA